MKPRVNMQVRRLIEKSVPIEITCDRHHSELVNGFSMETKTLVCSKCPKVPDHRKYKALEYSHFESCCLKLLELMTQRMEELKECIGSLNDVVNQCLQPKGS